VREALPALPQQLQNMTSPGFARQNVGLQPCHAKARQPYGWAIPLSILKLPPLSPLLRANSGDGRGHPPYSFKGVLENFVSGSSSGRSARNRGGWTTPTVANVSLTNWRVIQMWLMPLRITLIIKKTRKTLEINFRVSFNG
jgi:hypothetical protein